jgi:cobyrinic acid a,c-diamide synthase
MSANPRGLIIAAPASGSGKTTVTLGLLRALGRRGIAVQPYKCGPDYIEFHFANVLANPDEPLADIRGTDGAPAAERGSRRGAVTGSFFHVIDAAA